MKRYLLFNFDGYDKCSGGDGIIGIFETKEELVRFALQTEYEDDTISVYDLLNEIGYDNQTVWNFIGKSEDKEYWVDELELYLSEIKE